MRSWREGLPRDTEVEALLRTGCKSGVRGVEVISGLEHFRTAISLHGKVNASCSESKLSCGEKCLIEVENVTTVPTVKIYKNGVRVKRDDLPKPTGFGELSEVVFSCSWLCHDGSCCLMIFVG
ncbi:hypothetical protein HPP92_003610 [Vanilla planifolia]|uniref:Uncharacterized protein n=1 Tax=Vanilla planifolia TaxID=51239 RepID=A0A835S9F3_VANPL|nr:hypothetical protein HPP92_003998 [Vanilla planifolia]KAG0503538.1 hypothetical protein HPP92_003610 [Vanilla planifolia]